MEEEDEEEDTEEIRGSQQKYKHKHETKPTAEDTEAIINKVTNLIKTKDKKQVQEVVQILQKTYKLKDGEPSKGEVNTTPEKKVKQKKKRPWNKTSRRQFISNGLEMLKKKRSTEDVEEMIDEFEKNFDEKQLNILDRAIQFALFCGKSDADLMHFDPFSKFRQEPKTKEEKSKVFVEMGIPTWYQIKNYFMHKYVKPK